MLLAPSSKYIWLWPYLTISTSVPPSPPAQITYWGFLNWSSWSATTLSLPQSSLSTAARTIQFQQKPDFISSLFHLLILAHITHHSPSCPLSARPSGYFFNKKNTLPSHGLRHVSPAWNTFLRELNSKLPHFFKESSQMSIYQWGLSWAPYMKQQCPGTSIIFTLFILTGHWKVHSQCRGRGFDPWSRN